jgi:hypothetical protein
MVTVGCWKYCDRSLNLNGFADIMNSRREARLLQQESDALEASGRHEA